MKAEKKEVIAEAGRLGLKIDRANGRYSVGVSGEYFVDNAHFDTMSEVNAFLAGYQLRTELERKEKEPKNV